jgi:DNA modification methylase
MSATQPQVTLTWANKHIPTVPAPVDLTLRETFSPLSGTHPAGGDACNALYHGDNRAVLAHLLAAGWAGRFRLVYADPPYNSGLAWTRKVRRRGPDASSADAVLAQQPQYADAWDESAYLQFLYERLPLLRDLLAADGSLWLHCDHRHAHHLRCLLEEVFGAKNYLNTITWRSQTPRGAKVNAFYFANSAHAIHVFAKERSAPTCWTPAKKTLILSEAQAAAEFMRDERGFFRTSDPGTFSFASLQRLHAEGRLYAPYGGEVVLDAAARRAYCSKGGNIGVKYYLADLGGGRHAVERGVDNIWDDIPGLGTTPNEDLGYPTQKTEALLTRILNTATQPGDWVLDPFMGSGTTLAVAQKLGRRWAGCDVGYGSVQTARRRLQAVIQAQIAAQGTLDPAPYSPASAPQHRFSVYAAPAPSAAAPLQAHLSITPIEGEPARIRVTVTGVAWSQPAGRTAQEWRSTIECVAIDPDYDGRTLRVAVADAPLKRTQLVAGDYVLPAAAAGAKVAVRVTDIWGQETLAVEHVPARANRGT